MRCEATKIKSGKIIRCKNEAKYKTWTVFEKKSFKLCTFHHNLVSPKVSVTLITQKNENLVKK